jgi:hypothetical protein
MRNACAVAESRDDSEKRRNSPTSQHTGIVGCPAETVSFPDDLHHEMAVPGQNVRILEFESNHGRTHEPPQ